MEGFHRYYNPLKAFYRPKSQTESHSQTWKIDLNNIIADEGFTSLTLYSLYRLMVMIRIPVIRYDCHL